MEHITDRLEEDGPASAIQLQVIDRKTIQCRKNALMGAVIIASIQKVQKGFYVCAVYNYACGDLVQVCRQFQDSHMLKLPESLFRCFKDWCVPVVHVSLMYRNVFSYYSLDTPFNYSCGCNARARSFPTCETVRIYKLADGSNTQSVLT